MAIIGFLKNRSLEKKLQRSLWIAFVFSIFISTVLSKPLWDTLPLIFEVQFPWRWLNVVSIFAPILAAGGFSICLKWYKNEKTKIYPVAVFGSILIGLALSISWAISTGKFISPEKTQTEIQNAIDDQGFKFWWTIWAKEDLKEIRSEKVSAGNRKIEITEWKDTDREFVVEEGQAARARVAVFYHPNWKVFINNQKFETQPDSSGAITFYVPPEKSAVSLKFVETKEVSLAKNISLAAWIFIPLLAVFIFVRKNRSENQ